MDTIYFTEKRYDLGEDLVLAWVDADAAGERENVWDQIKAGVEHSIRYGVENA